MRRFLALFVPFVIIVGVFVVADRVLVGVAENRIAEELQRSQRLPLTPDVDVRGFPFLTQVLRGRYSEIDADLRDPPVGGGLAVEHLQVRLRGVRIKLAALAAGDVSSVPVDSATATGTVTYEALDAVARRNLPREVTKVHFGAAADNRLKVTGTYSSSLLSAKISTSARVVVKDGRLRIELVPGTLDGVPAAFRPQVQSVLEKASRLPELPMDFEPDSVTVTPDAIRIEAHSDTLNLSR
jgi:LmeA-like phospholipid-binding